MGPTNMVKQWAGLWAPHFTPAQDQVGPPGSVLPHHQGAFTGTLGSAWEVPWEVLLLQQ